MAKTIFCGGIWALLFLMKWLSEGISSKSSLTRLFLALYFEFSWCKLRHFEESGQCEHLTTFGEHNSSHSWFLTRCFSQNFKHCSSVKGTLSRFVVSIRSMRNLRSFRRNLSHLRLRSVKWLTLSRNLWIFSSWRITSSRRKAVKK